MTTILLIRHGENNWVKEHRLAGWIQGVVLNENGHAQAKALAERLADLPIKAIYSSPLERCQETAGHVAEPHKLLVSTLEAVGEVRYGTWEGEPIAELSKKKEWHTIQWMPSRFEFPEGESLRKVQARAVDALEALSLEHSDDMIVVCAHADLIKLVLAHYLGMHIDLFQRIGLAPASVSVLNLMSNGMVRVMRVNDDGPIKAPPPKKEEDGEATSPDVVVAVIEESNGGDARENGRA